MLLEIYFISSMEKITLLYMLGNLFVLGQPAELSSHGEGNNKTKLSQMKHFLEGIVMRHSLHNIDSPISIEDNEMASKQNVKENIIHTEDTSLSIANNDNSHNNLYYNSIIENEVLSNYRHDQFEDQVLHLYDTVTSHPLFYRVLSKDAFQVLIAEVTRLTLVINSTSAVTPVHAESVELQEQISDLVPSVNSDLVTAVTELNQQLDIVEPVIHNVTSAMQVIIADDNINENAVLDLIHEILPDPDEESLTKVEKDSQTNVYQTTIANENVSDAIVSSSSTTQATSTNQNISSENRNNYTSISLNPKINISLPKDNNTTTEDNEIGNLSSEIDLLNNFEVSDDLMSSLYTNKTPDLQILDILKIKPGSIYFDPYDPMSYLLALKSVYNQSNHVNNKDSATKGPSFSIPSEINKNSYLGDEKSGILNDEHIDIIEVPNYMPALVMSPGQYIESPLIPNDEEIVSTLNSSDNKSVSENYVTEEISIAIIKNENINSNSFQTIDETLIKNAVADNISIITQNQNLNSSLFQNIKEKDPTLFESAEMLIKTMTDSLSQKLQIRVNNTDNYNELNNNTTNIKYENNDEETSQSPVSSNNKKNDSLNNAEYLLGMMQQSMIPKPTTDQPITHNSLLNNFLNSWFKPILDYTNKTSNVISSLPVASYEILKNNTIHWPNIIATNITKDTVKTNQPSEVNNLKQQNISYSNELSHSILVNNTVSNHVPAYPDIINLNINIFQNEKQKTPSYSTVSSDIYDYYDYYDYEFPHRQQRSNNGDDSNATKFNEHITTEDYTIYSVDDTTAVTEVFETSPEDNASNIKVKGSIARLGIGKLPDKESIVIKKTNFSPHQKQTADVSLLRSQPSQLHSANRQGPIDPDNPLQFPRTTTLPPPEAINPAELLVSRTPNFPTNEHQKPNRQQLEDALILLLDLQDQFNTRNVIQPQLDAVPPPPKPPPAILNLQGPHGSGSTFQVSLSHGLGQSQQYGGVIQHPNPYPRPRPSEPFSNSVQLQPASISSSDLYNPYPELTAQPPGSKQGSNGGPPYPPYPAPPGYQGYPGPPPYPYYPQYPYPYPHYGGCNGGTASTSTSTGPGSAAAAAAAGGGCGGGGSTSTSTSAQQSAGAGGSPGTLAVDVGNNGGGGATSLPVAPIRPPSPPPVIPASANFPPSTRRPSTRAPPFSISFGNGRSSTTVAPQPAGLTPEEYDRVVGALNTLLLYLRKRQTQAAATPDQTPASTSAPTGQLDPVVPSSLYNNNQPYVLFYPTHRPSAIYRPATSTTRRPLLRPFFANIDSLLARPPGPPPPPHFATNNLALNPSVQHPSYSGHIGQGTYGQTALIKPCILC